MLSIFQTLVAAYLLQIYIYDCISLVARCRAARASCCPSSMARSTSQPLTPSARHESPLRRQGHLSSRLLVGWLVGWLVCFQHDHPIHADAHTVSSSCLSSSRLTVLSRHQSPLFKARKPFLRGTKALSSRHQSPFSKAPKPFLQGTKALSQGR